MGVDINVYRARIGCFNSRRKVVDKKKDYSGWEQLLWAIGTILAVLLIIGGVEANPGPTTGLEETILAGVREEIRKGLEDIRQQMEQTRIELKQLRTGVYEKIETNSENIGKLQQENNRLQFRIDNLEANQRKKNLIFFGIQEERWEGRLDTYDIVFQICGEFFNMFLNENHIEEVFRVGRGRNRPIIVKFASMHTKECIMSRLKNLKGTKIRVDQDFSFEVRNKRKLLTPFMKEARLKGNFATLVNDKLKINGNVYDLEFCQKNFHSPEFWIRKSPRRGRAVSIQNPRITDRGEERIDVTAEKGDERTHQQHNVWNREMRKSADSAQLVGRDGSGERREVCEEDGHKRSSHEQARRASNEIILSSPSGSLLTLTSKKDQRSYNLRSWCLSGDRNATKGTNS